MEDFKDWGQGVSHAGKVRQRHSLDPWHWKFNSPTICHRVHRPEFPNDWLRRGKNPEQAAVDLPQIATTRCAVVSPCIELTAKMRTPGRFAVRANSRRIGTVRIFCPEGESAKRQETRRQIWSTAN